MPRYDAALRHCFRPRLPLMLRDNTPYDIAATRCLRHTPLASAYCFIRRHASIFHASAAATATLTYVYCRLRAKRLVRRHAGYAERMLLALYAIVRSIRSGRHKSAGARKGGGDVDTRGCDAYGAATAA